MNVVILVGNVGQDPEVRVTSNGTPIMRFSMATQECKRDQEGNWESFPVWHQVKVFGKSADALGEFLSKGHKVAVNGKLACDSWEDDQGNRKTFVYVVAFNVDVLNNLDRSNDRPAEPRQQRPPQRQRKQTPFDQPRRPASRPRAEPDYPPDDEEDPFGGYDGN